MSAVGGGPRDPGPAPPAAELLEIVDEAGRVVGLAPRARCHGDPALRHRSVHIFVRDGRGRIFLQKRAPTKDVQPGKWDTSVGGHLDPGEGYETAALRELREELGVELDHVGALVHCHDYVWRSLIETEHVRTYSLAHEGPFRLHPDEIDQGRFWSEDELRAAWGTGCLTPNLEDELERLGIVVAPPRGA